MKEIRVRIDDHAYDVLKYQSDKTETSMAKLGGDIVNQHANGETLGLKLETINKIKKYAKNKDLNRYVEDLFGKIYPDNGDKSFLIKCSLVPEKQGEFVKVLNSLVKKYSK